MNAHDNVGFVDDTITVTSIGPKKPKIPFYGDQILTNHYELQNVGRTSDKDNGRNLSSSTANIIDEVMPPIAAGTDKERDTWGKGIEFLLSCIAMSVGLGNVWRFPFTALENGGGAFLIPYLIVLLLVGKPLYFMEMIIGQFSSKGSVKCYDLSPAMRGNYYLI